MPIETPPLEEASPELNTQDIIRSAYEKSGRKRKDVRSLTETLPDALVEAGLEKIGHDWINKDGVVILNASQFLDLMNKAATKFPHEPNGVPDEYDEAMAVQERQQEGQKTSKQPFPERSPRDADDLWYRKGQYK